MTMALLRNVLFNGAHVLSRTDLAREHYRVYPGRPGKTKTATHGLTEQGLFNHQLIAVEDWTPQVAQGILSASLDPTLFGQFLWTPPVPYSRSSRDPQASHASIVDYLMNPPEMCEM